jgi:tetratricopeptide (TPR) repeat protein
MVVAWVGLAGFGVASACLNDSVVMTAEQRYRSQYQQVFADTVESHQRQEARLAADGAQFRYPLHAVSDIHHLERHLAALAEPTYPLTWWVKMGGVLALAGLLIAAALIVGWRRRVHAWRAYAGDDAGPPTPTRWGPSPVGAAIVIGILLAASAVMVDHIADLDMSFTRMVAPAPTAYVPAPHHFPNEKKREWQRANEPDDRRSERERDEKDEKDEKDNDRTNIKLPRLPDLSPTPGKIYREPVTLRFAMVHDILHERYVRPGQSYYRARNQRTRETIDRLEKPWDAPENPRPPAEWFGHVDDLSVGLERLGELDEAEELLRVKLRVQGDAEISTDERYTTYANLGTVLAHGSVRGTLAGDKKARQSLKEALDFIDKAIDANPNAHFGREVWQKAAIEYLLAASGDPQIFERYDMVGNRLVSNRSYQKLRDSGAGSTYVGRELVAVSRPLFADLSYEFEPKSYTYTPPTDDVELEWLEEIDEPIARQPSDDRVEVRDYIRKVGAEGDWGTIEGMSQNVAAPFDDPVLGIVGMWRLGGGPNPHFALTLGGISERVGRPRLAWAAYERAVRMKQAWPETARDHLVEYSRARQAELEAHLGEPADSLRESFEAELDAGLAYQSKHRQFEEETIAQGVEPAPGFYDAFFDEHDSIATPPGSREKVAVVGWMRPDWRTAYAAIPWMLLMGGLFGLIRALTFSAAIEESNT